jgi:hypothetical protein
MWSHTVYVQHDPTGVWKWQWRHYKDEISRHGRRNCSMTSSIIFQDKLRHGSRNCSMMSSIIIVGNDAITRTAMMLQAVLQDDDFNQDDNDPTLLNFEQYNTSQGQGCHYMISRHGSRNCSMMSSIIFQDLLVKEQYNIETSLVSCCFASSKIPQYNGSGKDANI